MSEANKQFLNECIRTCILARKVLKGLSPKWYSMHIFHATEGQEELFALKKMVNVHREFWALRFKSFDYGLISEVFALKYFISQRRLLDISKRK